jgi:hypothetical protein
VLFHLLLNMPNNLKDIASFGPTTVEDKVRMALSDFRAADLVAF